LILLGKNYDNALIIIF